MKTKNVKVYSRSTIFEILAKNPSFFSEKYFLKLLIHGEDSVRSGVFVSNLVSKAKKDESKEVLQRDLSSFDKEKIKLILEEVLFPDLFLSSKLVVVRNLFKSGFLDEEFLVDESLLNLFSLSECDVLIYEEYDLKFLEPKNSSAKKQNFSKSLEKILSIFEEKLFNILKKDEIVAKVLQLSKNLGVYTSKEVAEEIVELSGENFLESVNNLKILASFVGFSGKITKSDLEELYKNEVLDVWGFSRNLFSKDKRKKLEFFEKLLKNPDNSFDKLFGMLVYEVRTFYRFLVFKEEKSPEISKIPYFKREFYSRLKIRKEKVFESFRYFSKVEKDFKSGKIDGSDALRKVLLFDFTE